MAVDWRRMLEVTLGVPATEGNALRVLRNGDEIFPSMLEAIRASRRSVDLLTFVYWEGEIAVEFARTLAERAENGVRVRVLLDAVGARRIDEQLIGDMLDRGVDVRWFRPVDGDVITDMGHRTHRKVLVCDETVGFTGGVGIAEEWTGDARGPQEWRDTHLRIEGPAVDGLRGAFLDNWFEVTGEVVDPEVDTCVEIEPQGACTVQVVRGSAGAAHSAIATLQTLTVAAAERSIRIEAAYFTPNEYVLDALVEALGRGVAVDIVVPGPHADKEFMRLAGRALFEQLLEAGARIWVYEPTMLHCKVVLVDDSVAVLGSANFDDRSAQHDDEVCAVVFDDAVVAELTEHFDADVAASAEVDLDEWEERGVLTRVAERIVDSVSDVL